MAFLRLFNDILKVRNTLRWVHYFFCDIISFLSPMIPVGTDGSSSDSDKGHYAAAGAELYPTSLMTDLLNYTVAQHGVSLFSFFYIIVFGQYSIQNPS